LFRSGAGAGHIAKQLHSAGLAVSAAEANSGHIVRLLAQPALTGEKRLSLGDERFVLDGYYPALLDKVTFEEVRLLAESRGRKRVKGDIPSLLTGFGVTVCGYCGSAMKSQTMANKRRPDGTLADGHRRLQCVRINSGTGCNVKGSCSSAPLERALMRYCSDMINLESLYAGDRAAVPKAELSIARQQLTEIDRRLGRLAEALMEGGDKISAFVSRAHTLQKEQANMQARVKALEVSLAEVTRSDISGLDQSWRRLETGVENLAFESRMQARQLVSDTFERIVVYHHGVRPNDTPKGTIDVILRAKGGTSRMLRIDKLANWTLSEDFFDPAATPSTLVSDGSSL
jgi:hypothetical protein